MLATGAVFGTTRAAADPGAATAGWNGLASTIGGSVLLRTKAPPAAIICAPHLLGARRPSEEEYIVDRRRLNGGVTVLERVLPLPAG